MTFDDLLESNRLQEEPPAPPPPPKPRPHWLWRVTRPFVMIFDVVGLLFAVGSLFTWNDVREQAASSLPRKIDYAAFAFLAVYGFVRTCFDLYRERRWHWVNVVSGSCGIALLWFYMGIGPPGLLIRLSAAFDNCEGVREKFVILGSSSRTGVSRLNPSPEKGYYTIAREGRLNERWEVYLGSLGRSRYVGDPSFVTLSMHRPRRGFDWIDRTTPEATYDLQGLIDQPDVVLDRNIAVFAELPLCAPAPMNEMLRSALKEFSVILLLEYFPNFDVKHCKVDQLRVFFKYRRPGISGEYRRLTNDAISYLQDTGHALERGFGQVRCPSGNFHKFALSEPEQLRKAIGSCGNPR